MVQHHTQKHTCKGFAMCNATNRKVCRATTSEAQTDIFYQLDYFYNSFFFFFDVATRPYTTLAAALIPILSPNLHLITRSQLVASAENLCRLALQITGIPTMEGLVSKQYTTYSVTVGRGTVSKQFGREHGLFTEKSERT